jgi:hypothetical protein
VVRGINLQTLLWTDGKALIPGDFRVYHTPKTVRAKTTISRLREAKERKAKVCAVLVCQLEKPKEYPRLRLALANKAEE